MNRENTDNSFANRVFINCPFDPGYDEIFRASTYTIIACGFYPVSALQQNDGGPRLDKLSKLIKSCKYSIHDISMVELDNESKLPRFNMPFELGIDYGCRTYGAPALRGKNFLIFESSQHKLGVYLSDLAGNDPACHIGQPINVITEIRKWLYNAVSESDEFCLPGEQKIVETFNGFCEQLPFMCEETKVNINSISYVNLIYMMRRWINRIPNLIKRTPLA